MSINGNFVEAAEALRIGLVNHMLPHGQLLPFTRELVQQFTGSPAGREVLGLYDQGCDLSLNGALALETAHVAHGRPWDADAFAARGSAASARQRPNDKAGHRP